MKTIMGWSSICLGAVLILGACCLLFKVFRELSSDRETETRFLALKSAFRISSILAVSGIIMIFLGLLYLMGLISRLL